jgi:hypothetical protein
LSLYNTGTEENNGIIANNTVTGNPITTNTGIVIDGPSSWIMLSNNIIENHSTGINISNTQSHLNLRYCLFWNNLLNGTNHDFAGFAYTPLQNPGCKFENPELDIGNAPIWNSSIKSSCIDAGEPFVYDEDGTPSDIGAKTAIEHAVERYRFEDMDPDKYYWMCFPVLDTITADATQVQNFFDKLMETEVDENMHQVPKFLYDITWTEGTEMPNLAWQTDDEGHWTTNLLTHLVASEKGYKVRMLERTISISESGLLANPLTDVTVQATVENWIGYTLKESALPQDALAPIWDDLLMVKTKDWCLSKLNSCIWLSATRVYPLNYGDMVSIITRHNDTFHWGNPNIVPPDKKPIPTKFEFPEKKDYIPIYIDLKNVDMNSLKEIGFYLNSCCKGAVVVTDTLVQLNANLEIDDVINANECEFVFYYESKNQPLERKTVHLTESMLTNFFIDGNESYPVYQVKINGADLGVSGVTVTELLQNYPNPFNPSTTISYRLKEDGKATLDIYNIRGQLVKTLADGFNAKGSHSASWDGKDARGNACASGVYLYKLTIGKTTITRKMMILK